MEAFYRLGEMCILTRASRRGAQRCHYTSRAGSA